MNTKLKRLVAGVVTTAIVGAIPLLSASPASAATLAGPATVKTSGGVADLNSGDANDAWTLRLPAGAACTSDGNNGGRAHTYMIPASQNPATDLAFNGSGSIVGASTGTAGAGTFKNNLYTTGDAPGRNIALNLGDAAIINIPNFAYTVWADGQIPAGAYNIGIACIDLDEANAINNYWNQRITVTYPGGDAAGAQISWAVGEAPVAPVITTITPGDTTLSVAFSHTASTPASSYTASAVPDGGDTDCTGGTVNAGPVAASPVPMTGLVNACTYAVTVTAANGVGSPATSAPVNATPDFAVRPGVTGLTSTSGVGNATLSWTPPAPETPARTGYSISWTAPGQPNGSGTAAAGDTSFLVTPLAPGVTYTCTVTPTYPAPHTASPASVPCVGNSAQSIQQHIEVNRPVGALVLTQECGTYGALDAEVATDDFPALGAVGATGTGSAPFQSWSDTTFTGSTPDDPNYAEYPYPVDEDGPDNDLATEDDNDIPDPTYPTHCGVDLHVAKLVTSGPNAGKYFQASGRLNQVTVVDTRDTDPGWNLNGAISEFRKQGPSGPLAGAGNAFTGKALGWTPKLSFRTGAIDTDFDGVDDYFPDAAAASAAYPGTTGIGTPGKLLGSATSTHGLGIVQFDARLKVLIPVNKVNGRYTGTLTFTFV